MTDVQKTIWLNDVEYPIEGKVQRRRSSAWPAEFRSGRIEAQDYTPTRKQMWGAMKGGMGKERWDPGADDRFWTSADMETSLNVTSLGPLVTTMGTDASTDFGVAPIKIVTYQDNVWAMGNNQIAYWDATGSTWVTAEPTTPLPDPTDAIVFYSVIPASITSYSDADPEVITCDGYVRSDGSGSYLWADLHDATIGGVAFSSGIISYIAIQSHTSSDQWLHIFRTLLSFPLSDIPGSATITGITLYARGSNKSDGLGCTPTLNVYSSTPLSNTDVTTGDYDQFGTTAYCDTAITYANFVAAWNSFEFNTTGVAAAQTAYEATSKVLNLGLREAAYDVADSAPAWSATKISQFVVYAADGAYPPYLSVTYTHEGSTFAECLCVASSSGRSVKTSEATGGTWTEMASPYNIKWLTQFDNRLCGLADTNKGFRYSEAHDLYSAWNDQPNFPNLPDDFTDLFVGKNAEGESALYFLTPKGLYYLDVFTNFISDPTDVKWEEDADSGKVGIYWMGDLYIAVNKGIYKISGRTVTYIGPDRDDGLETLRQGVITDMIGVGPWLVIAVDNSSTSTNYSCILKRYVTGNHWHTVYKSGTANKRIRSLMWKDGTLYFGEDTNVKSLPFPKDTDNVKLASGHTYATAGELELPKFDGGFQAIPKVAHKLWAITQDCATAGALDDKFDISYKFNDATSYTSLGSFSTSPKPTALVWPTSGDAIGEEFENIQLKVAATRGTTTTNSPKLESLVLEYRVVPPVIYDWTMTVEAKKYGKKRGQNYIDDLETAVASKTLLKFYPTGKQGDTSYLVEVKSLPRAVKGTEYGQEGFYQLTVGQVVD